MVEKIRHLEFQFSGVASGQDDVVYNNHVNRSITAANQTDVGTIKARESIKVSNQIGAYTAIPCDCH